MKILSMEIFPASAHDCQQQRLRDNAGRDNNIYYPIGPNCSLTGNIDPKYLHQKIGEVSLMQVIAQTVNCRYPKYCDKISIKIVTDEGDELSLEVKILQEKILTDSYQAPYKLLGRIVGRNKN